MNVEIYDSIWDAIEEHPAEAAKMKVCSQLLIAVREAIRMWDVSARDAAARLGISLERLGQIADGDINEFTLDDLIKLATQAGLTVRMEIAAAA